MMTSTALEHVTGAVLLGVGVAMILAALAAIAVAKVRGVL